MKSLRQILNEADKKKIAVGHFNISNLEMLKAIAAAAAELQVSVIIGVSEGEREFLDVHNAAALIKDLREKHGQPVFLNADHTHSFEKVEEAARAGYDAVLFDGGKLNLEENIKQTKKAVALAKKINPDVLVEGELGNIGSGSIIRKEIPKGTAIKPKDLTKPEEAADFVKKTGVDLLAPAVGNIHGMFANAPEPALDIERIRAIKKAAKAPLVLHGASGNTDEELRAAISAGISVIHISTELRVAWRKGMEESLKKSPDEVAPYKLMAESIKKMKKVLEDKLRLFNG
jgi:fructose-bisphosphate aldolase class II